MSGFRDLYRVCANCSCFRGVRNNNVLWYKVSGFCRSAGLFLSPAFYYNSTNIEFICLLHNNSHTMSSSVTIRFTDNQSGHGENVSINPSDNLIDVSNLLKGTSQENGYITNVELQSNFTDIEAPVWISSTEVGLLSTSQNQLTFPGRTSVKQVSLRVKRLA